MKKTHVMLITAAVVLLGSTAALNVTVANESGKDAKSVAWYVANIQEAKAQNQACHDSPSNQSTENCANALHALEITFKGGN